MTSNDAEFMERKKRNITPNYQYQGTKHHTYARRVKEFLELFDLIECGRKSQTKENECDP